MFGGLFNHPDFQSGVKDAEGCFNEWYEGAPLSEDQMINEVEENLGRAITEQSKVAAGALGGRPSYIHHLGFVFGTINKGMEG